MKLNATPPSRKQDLRKGIACRILVLLALLCGNFGARAQLLLYEPFNYTPDASSGLAAQSGGAWLVYNTPGDSILVASGSLSYTGLPASVGNKVKYDGAGAEYYTPYAVQTTGSVYGSYLFNVSSLSTLNTTGSFFAGFGQNGAATTYGALTWVRLSSAAGKYNIGISARNATTVSWLPVDLTPGTPNFVVFAYDFISGSNNDAARIWLNTSAIGGSEPNADATALNAVGTADLTSAAKYFLNQGTANTTPFMEVDEVRVGTTWASVTPSSSSISASALAGFGDVCSGTASNPNSFTLTGVGLSSANVLVGPASNLTFATTAAGPYTSSLTLTPSGGSLSQTVYVSFTPGAVQSYALSIPVNGGGVSSISVTSSGNGVNSAPTVTAGAATSISTTGATLPGTITATGCSAVSAYGIEWSSSSGFANGSGTPVAGTNLAGNAFSVPLSGLSAGATYYYHAYAINSAGTAYSAVQSFTTLAPTAPVATAATAVTNNSFTANWDAVPGASGYRLDVYTLVPGQVSATIAGWNTNTATAASQTADVGNAANLGVQQLTVNGGNAGTISYLAGPSGTSGTPNPYSVSSTAWDNGADNKYWQVDVNTTGASSLTLSSLQGSSGTGPRDFKVQYRVGAAGTWTDVAGGTVTIPAAVSAGNLSTWGAVTNLPLPAAAENQPLVSLRWIQTSNTSVSSGTVANGGTSRIAGIYIKGMVAGNVPSYVTGYNNVATGNVTSYLVSGLSIGTTYYYVVRTEQDGGTSTNSNEISVTTSNSIPPALSTSALTAFGSVCVNTGSAANPFTISGTNLTAANVTVGPLAGYAFSTSASGPFTASLNLPQPGGAYTQTVYVQLTPNAVQNYSGSIPVSGGGASGTVAATGTGVNSLATVSTGAASSITTSAATLSGSVTATGCSAASAYGFEWSSSSGFANGSGTQLPASNLASGSFSASLSGLAQGTTYYYHAYATNNGGTSYGAEMSFTTNTPNPLIVLSSVAAFGNVCTGTTGTPGSFTITGSNLSTAPVTVGPLAGYSFATTQAGPYSNTLSLTQAGGSFAQTVFIQFAPTAVQSYNGSVPVGGGGTAAQGLSVSGAGINDLPTVGAGSAVVGGATSATVNSSISSNGCTALSGYGVEWSTTNGFANGSGTALTSSNLASGTFSAALSGLAPATTYYFHTYASNAAGTAYGTQGSFTTATPALSAGTLTSFGSVCLNSSAGPNSFTINGTNLTGANLTVGPLAGYTFSATSGGTYSNTLSLPQGGGTQALTVYVKFTPTTLQSYSGSIPVSGGGLAGNVSVAASGTGINTAPSVAGSSVSNLTANSATVSGTVSNTGCSSLTAYGVEWSTTNGFANGSGTAVPASNLSGGSFSTALSGLAQSTTYYYHTYATNAGGTTYSAQGSFTTATPVATLTTTALTPFGSTCINTVVGPNSFTLSGTNLNATSITVGPLSGYLFSTSATGTFTPSLTLTQAGGTYSQQVYVRFAPVSAGNYTNNIPVFGGGGLTNVAASGTGLSTPPTVATLDASNLSAVSALLNGSVADTGCTGLTQYGFEYSTVPGFANGTGIQVVARNLAANHAFSSALNVNIPGNTYYYHAIASNRGGVAFGAEKKIVLPANVTKVLIFPAPADRNGMLHVRLADVPWGTYAVELFTPTGQQAFRREYQVQSGYNRFDINLAQVAAGLYYLRVATNGGTLLIRPIVIH